jgi:hypothetical protein
MHGELGYGSEASRRVRRWVVLFPVMGTSPEKFASVAFVL